jgi:porin
METKALHLALFLTLWAGMARAQEASAQQRTNPGVPSVTNSGTETGNNLPLKPLTAPVTEPSFPEVQAPINLRPFIFVLPRDHFLRDWFGLLPTLEDDGITPTLTYVSNIAGNVSGGKNQGAAYADNIGLNLLFDLDKIAGIDGGSFLLSMSQRDGSSLSLRHVGNIFAIQQLYGGESFKIISVAYQQKLMDDHIELRIGRLSAGDDFLVSKYDYLFMQNGFDGNPVGIFFNAPGMSAYPAGTWGALLKLLPTKRTYIMGGIYNGDATIRADDHYGVDLSFRGPVFAIGEMGYRCNGLPGDSEYLGDYKVGGWYDDNLFTEYPTLGQAQQPAAERRGNWGVYGLFDQVVFPYGELYSDRGLGIFGSVLVSPDQSVSQLPYFFTAGIACRGPIPARPTDMAAFGALWGQFSSDLHDAEVREAALSQLVAAQGHEAVLEWLYRFNFNRRSMFIQPDIQYVIRPGGTETIRNALVIGAQIGINF